MTRLLKLMGGCGYTTAFNGSSFFTLVVTTIIGIVLTSSFHGGLLNVEGASVPKLENSIALDYVSLTDHQNGRQSSVGENETNATIWVVGGVTECSQLPNGCSCVNKRASKAASVVCTCSDEKEVVHLKEMSESRRPFESLSWEVKACSKVVIHQNFLSTLTFNNGNKLKLLLKFSDVTNLVIHEAAFTITDSGSFLSHETTVEFNNCDIDVVPPKAFPSYLRLLQFQNCRIGTLSSRFIQSLQIDTISFINSAIVDVQPDAFYQRAMINFLLAQNTTFRKIQKDAIASGVQHLNWTNTNIDRLEEFGLSGLIVNVHLANCTISDVQSGGFSVKTWSVVTLANNTFNKVSHRGIDLTQLPGEESSAFLLGNSWNLVEKDFIVTGSREIPYVIVENNTFLQICTCGSTFVSLLSLNESKSWFLDQIFESSRCPLEEKDKRCFNYENENRTNNNNNNDDDKNFISYNELHHLCSEEMYMCTSEVNEMHVNPQLPNRLQLLAFFIGAFVLFMVVSLLLTMMVYMIRKQRPRKEHDNGSSDLSRDIPRKEFVKSLNPDPYHHHHHHHPGAPSSNSSTTSTSVTQKISKTPSMPTRLAFLEDVEMEDKGVQTLPTELSADIIEGLREKLSKPDSFWDAKETIDHLYDLIHVRDQAGNSSSHPDVTCSDNSTAGEPNVVRHSSSNNGSSSISSDFLKPLVTPRRNIKVIPMDNNRRSMSTFAQLSTSPTKTVGVGPSNSNSHIYSELSAIKRESRLLASPTSSTPPPLPTSSPPMLAEYTEPRDFQTHIYAELLCAAAASNPDTYYGGGNNATKKTYGNGIQSADIGLAIGQQYGIHNPEFTTSSSSVIPTNTFSSPQHNHHQNNGSKNLNDLNMEYNNKTCGSGNGSSSSIISDPNIPNSPIKRPLPSIPPKPIVSNSIIL